MCGRYRLSRKKQIIEGHFDVASGEEDWSPRYNIAPTQPVLLNTGTLWLAARVNCCLTLRSNDPEPVPHDLFYPLVLFL